VIHVLAKGVTLCKRFRYAEFAAGSVPESEYWVPGEEAYWAAFWVTCSECRQLHDRYSERVLP
jgi:hypothetical protein